MENNLKYGNVEITVLSKGAELRSYKVGGKEFVWEANPEYWGASSPVLFPFVGAIKNGKYRYNEKEYELTTRHGFARTNEFELVESGENYLEYRFQSNEETLKLYPFEFELYIKYVITKADNSLEIKYEVVNKNDEKMYFSIGAHPAFALELNENKKLSDYYLEFEKEETLKKYIVAGPLVSEKTIDMLQNEKVLRLSDTIFDDDAVIFENTKSDVVTLKSDKNSKELKFEYKGFPYLAFWSKPKAPFVCIEPWYGITDFENCSGKLEDKKGIVLLDAGKEFSANLKITGKF